jgi:hypothetical protein
MSAAWGIRPELTVSEIDDVVTVSWLALGAQGPNEAHAVERPARRGAILAAGRGEQGLDRNEAQGQGSDSDDPMVGHANLRNPEAERRQRAMNYA